MKSFVSLILEDEIGIFGKYDNEGNPRQGDLFKGKFPDKKKAMLNFSQYKKMLGPNIDPKTTSVPTPEVLADKLAQGKPAVTVRMGIDPHTNELDATRSAKAQAKTAARQVAKETRSAAKGASGKQGTLEFDDKMGLRRKAKIASIASKSPEYAAAQDRLTSQTNPGARRIVAGTAQQPVTVGSLEATPKPSTDPTIIRTPTRAPVRTPVKGPSLTKQFVRAGKAVLRSPLARVGGRALGGAATLLAPYGVYSDSDEIATKLTGYEKEEMERRKQNPNRSVATSNLTTFVRSPGTKF